MINRRRIRGRRNDAVASFSSTVCRMTLCPSTNLQFAIPDSSEANTWTGVVWQDQAVCPSRQPTMDRRTCTSARWSTYSANDSSSPTPTTTCSNTSRNISISFQVDMQGPVCVCICCSLPCFSFIFHAVARLIALLRTVTPRWHFAQQHIDIPAIRLTLSLIFVRK